MFVRTKKNKSGTISIQIIDKSNGYKLVETVGCAKTLKEVDPLILKGKKIIESYSKDQIKLFEEKNDTDFVFVSSISNRDIEVIGPELIFGTLFNRIGFSNVVSEELFKDIVVTRLVYPTSKLKTIDYLYRYTGVQYSVDDLYRFLDKLNNKYKEEVEQVSFAHTKKILGKISVVFYDMTTLYFDAEDEDDLRKIGFSKDGKFQKPQIMIGLLVANNGFPIGYDIFEGNIFEGKTLIPIIHKFEDRYKIDKPIIVADAGLLSKSNIANLVKDGYEYIIGARIKNESDELKQTILESSKNLLDGESFIINKFEGNKLIVNYSIKRLKKDKYNRDKGLRKLERKVASGYLTKEAINNRGYNKFLKLNEKIEVSIDKNKIQEDEKWDGLKGYVTNTELSPSEVIENYKQLWEIERAFRISKTDLRIRPIYHYRRRRIESHICISFVAYTIYKELEKQLKEANINMSVKRASELTQNMYQLNYFDAGLNDNKKILLKMDYEQNILFKLIHQNRVSPC